MEYKISIILPVYNGEKYIAKSIRSIISQSFQDWELLVIDDGSIDSTENIVLNFCNKDSRVKYFKNDKNLGIQKTLNRGLALSQGKYIARIDADDEWVDREKILIQFDFLEKNPDYGLVGTGAILIDSKGVELSRYLLPEKDKDIRKKILGRNCFVHSSVFFRKELVGDGYSESVLHRHIEDQELWLRIGLVSKIFNLQKHSVSLTVSRDSITSKNRTIQAKRMLSLCFKYKDKYPNKIGNILFGYSRYVFFLVYSYIPFSKSIVYKLQSFFKK